MVVQKKKKAEIVEAIKESTTKYSRQIWRTRFSRDGQFLFGSGYDASLHCWKLADPRFESCAQHSLHHGWLQALSVSAFSDQLVTGDSWGQLVGWKYDSDKGSVAPDWVNPKAHDGWIRDVAIHPQKPLFATAANDSAVCLWSLDDGRLIAKLDGHAPQVFSVQFHPSENRLVTGDIMGAIRVWDLDSRKVLHQWEAKGLHQKHRIQQCGGARVLCFDDKGETLACGGQKDPQGGFAGGTPAVLTFDWKTGKINGELTVGGSSDGFVYDIIFHPAHQLWVATSSAFPGKGHVFCWKTSDKKPLFQSKKMPNGRSLSLHPDGQRIAITFSKSANGNGRRLVNGEYQGGSAEIQLAKINL